MVKSQSPKISVLTCCYNASAFVEEAISSILHQSYKGFEYMLVDDGSMDNTLFILKKYAAKDKRIVLIEKEHSGLTYSLNVGLEHARGDWIARLDADDIAMPERLSDQLNFMQNNDGVVLLGGGCIEIDQTGVEIKEHSYPSDHHMLMNHLRTINKFFPHSSAFFNRQLVVDLGGYNERFSRSQDCDLWLRISEIGKIACLDVPVIKLRKHSNMISNTNNGRLQMIMGTCAVICHFRRNEGLSDPSKMEENRWQEFLDWAEQRLEEEGIFQERRSWQTLRDAYYKHNGNKIEGARSVATYLIKNPKALKAIWRRFFKTDFALKLAKESKTNF